MSVPKFGFSAFLKIINANPRPQRTSVHKRCGPSTGGYDFHKSLRHRVQQVSFHGLSRAAVLASTQRISRLSERNSAEQALKQFFLWKDANPGEFEQATPLTFWSPARLYKVEFIPDFMTQIGDRRTAIHLWNTKNPLDGRLVRAVLSAVAARYPVENRPDDIAVLSLKNRTLYRWSEADRDTRALGNRLLEMLDMQFATARAELGLPASPDLDGPKPRPRP
ncbi:hypothetical protein EHH54_13240 [Rhizobium leguminosarum]|uniref:hypothetical protein n=1 Tax=Rhizobium leguminosarum TaxID=384 RepID=UPI000FEC2CD3|nr:hypothetical protein [Rhizobium leguminosarum]RWX40295.1 hypothetical protein EHH54_13240 [Rhizobium leguminosarum]